MEEKTSVSHRLDRTVIPVRYELRIVPDLDAGRFEGSEEILIEVENPVPAIVLNSAELSIGACWIASPSGGQIAAASTEIDEPNERIHLELKGGLAPGSYLLHVDFAGTLNDKLRGFYRIHHKDAAGNPLTIGATQFEATDARRAFPCFDEPDMKAVFSITLEVETGMLAVSNTPVLSEKVAPNGRRTVVFADTMRMSTYLVAFVVGPLEATDPVDVDGVPLRVIYPSEQRALTGFALEVAAFSLRFFNDYYAIPYPGQKLDLVALPDFAAGAMENLGCVTFRDSLLLVDRQSVTQGELHRVAEVIAHELAHMWFGDLVTMGWWNGIWLNEAFATFMSILVIEAFKPEWEPWVQFSLGRSAAFQIDALETTRPIEYPVESPDDAEGMFDVLTYQKGAAVLRMLERHLGEELFRRGIRAYLARHSYGNADTGDLWAALATVTDEPVGEIMNTWVFHEGFPRIKVERTASPERVRLTQGRFRYGRRAAADTHIWQIPLRTRSGAFHSGESKELRLLLAGRDVELELGQPADWVAVNSGADGFYRVEYSAELLAGLERRMFDLLSPVERFGLLDDAWASLLSGEMAAASMTELLLRFAAETDVEVWGEVSGCLNRLLRLVEGGAQARLRGESARIAGVQFQRLGWEPQPEEPERLRRLRGVLIEALCEIGRDEDSVARARAVVGRVLQEPDAIEPNVAAAAVTAVASVGTREEYDGYLEQSKTARTPQERLRYLYALARFPGEEEFALTLAMTLDGEVRTQNAPYLLGALLRHPVHGARAWSFIRENWETINTVFPANTIVRMLAGIRSLTSREVASQIEEFFADRTPPQGGILLRQHLELMGISVALREREADRFSAYLLARR